MISRFKQRTVSQKCTEVSQTQKGSYPAELADDQTRKQKWALSRTIANRVTAEKLEQIVLFHLLHEFF